MTPESQLSDASDDANATVRVLLVARHPLQGSDLGLEDAPDLAVVGLVRRLDTLPDALEETAPDVIVVDTALPGQRAFSIIEEVSRLRPRAVVLALTPDPPPVDDVARAVRAGAAGFVDVDLEPGEAIAAIRAVHGGSTWFEPAQMAEVLGRVADHLDVTATDRRSRLSAVVLGMVPLAGVVAGLLSLLWRRYLGQIGVRPVDLAIDPGSRVVDVVFSLLSFLGFFGPLLFIGIWSEQLRTYAEQKRALLPLVRRRRLLHVVLTVAVLAVGVFLVLYVDLVLALLVGPAVAIALLAAILDVQTEIPPLMRLRSVDVRRFVIGAIGVGFAVLFLLGGEALLRGPGFDRSGVNGILMHRLIGFRAQPVLHTDVGGDGETRELLYLGGNADLYVLVDPCNDNEIDFVSVGSSRLENIDEVTCNQPRNR